MESEMELVVMLDGLTHLIDRVAFTFVKDGHVPKEEEEVSPRWSKTMKVQVETPTISGRVDGSLTIRKYLVGTHCTIISKEVIVNDGVVIRPGLRLYETDGCVWANAPTGLIAEFDRHGLRRVYFESPGCYVVKSLEQNHSPPGGAQPVRQRVGEEP